MVTIGSLTWMAKVEGAASAQRKAEGVGDSMANAEEKAQGANEALGGTSGKLGTVSSGADRANNRFGRLTGVTGLLRSAIFFLGSTVSGLILKLTAVSSIAALLSGYISTLIGWIVGAWAAIGGLSGIVATLSGWVGTAIGLVKGFISWLAAGSAGALALAAAIGAVIGLFAVWVLEITGVMDWIASLGQMIGVQLPNWARDGLLILISLFAGVLATIGGFIVGFIEGFIEGGLIEGIRRGIERAGEVLDIFAGAWERTFGRVIEVVGNALDWVADRWESAIRHVTDLAAGLTEGITDAITGVWNTVIPDTVGFPEVQLPSTTIDAGPLGSTTVGGMTVFGGFDFDLPQLQTGGLIEETGAFIGHAGEAVLPADVTRNITQPSTGGEDEDGGGVTIETVEVEIGDQQLDLSNLTRIEMEDLAELIGRELGLEVEQTI